LRLLRGPDFTTRAGAITIPLPKYKEWLWREVESGRLGIAYANAPGWLVRIQGPVSAEMLHGSIRSLCERHGALRTRLFENGQQLYIATDANPQLHVIELTEPRETSLEEVLLKLRWAPFDTHKEPFFRPFLVRLGPEENVIGCVCHHLICDTTSMNIIVQDWLAAYSRELGMAQSDDTQAPYQYIDYLSAMDHWCDSPAVENRIAYWRRTLAKCSASTLPPDYPLARDSYTRLIRSAEFGLDAAETQRLRAAASDIGVTTINLLLAAKAVTMARILRADDITLRNVDHGRWDPALLHMVGSTDNSLCIRVPVDRTQDFTHFARRIQQIHLDAQSNDAPWGLVWSNLEQIEASDLHAAMNIVDYGASQIPGSSHALLSSAEPLALRLPDLAQSLRHHPPHSLSGSMQSSFVAHVKYLEGLYKPETIEKLIGQFMNTLRAVINNPTASIVELCS
jgi:Condensation domain